MTMQSHTEAPHTTRSTHPRRATKSTLADPFDAHRSTVSSRHGELALYSSQESVKGRPLLLLHSVNAAASSFEVKPIFDWYRGERRVYALDLPGFGNSSRDARRYDPERFAGAIGDALRQIAKEDMPADVLALSLSCEFAARAALAMPALVHSLAFLSPTGLSAASREKPVAHRARTGRAELAHRVLGAPLLGNALFRTLVTRPVLRHFLKKSFEGPVDKGLLEYGYASAHQPGARNAPLWFVSGALFTPDAVETLYARLTQPVLAMYDRDAYTSFERLEELRAAHPNWRAVRIEGTRGLPQFERPGETRACLDEFLREG